MTLPAMSAVTLDGVARLASVSLGELNRSADLLTRIDRKYVIGRDDLHALLADHADRLASLEIEGRRSFWYRSLYFDTPDATLHRAAATDRRRRVKVRTRVYADSGTAMLEVKAKDGRGRTVKHRQPHELDRVMELGDDGMAFVDDVTGSPGLAASLLPTLETRYLRTTVVEPSTDSRATIDVDLVCAHVDGRTIRFDKVIVETKSDLTPGPIDRWMWRHGHRPEPISKYSTALALLDPTLPGNKWHRTIARHFAA